MNNLKTFLIASPKNNYNPPVLSYRAFLVYGALLLLLRLFFGFISASGNAVDSGTLIQLINEERANRNLTTLSTHKSLIIAAGQKAQDMIDRDYFAHIDPDSNYVWGKITSAGYTPYRILGENLALDFSTSEGMIKAWLDSPTHRANLLHTEFIDQGLAALYGDYQGRYTNLTASLFGALASAPKPEVKSTPPPYATPYATPTNPPPPPTPPSPPYATPYTSPYETPYATPAQQTPPPLPPAAAPSPPPSPARGEGINAANPFAHRSTLLDFSTPLSASRFIFTLFGIFLLVILFVDSVIIYQHQLQIARSYSSYHLSTFVFIVLVSILIWWW